ncbi:Hydroxysteroid 17-beta dehydrogenase 4 [Balamuthia mandrillaris]
MNISCFVLHDVPYPVFGLKRRIVFNKKIRRGEKIFERLQRREKQRRAVHAMAEEIRFDGRVVVVTGAGGGLGRAYALLFAKRGAKVVVNDLGTSTKGEGAGSKAADIVVQEIQKAGGTAVANYDSVEHGDKIIKTALDAFGRVDIVINNAGILRDVSFVKMKDSDWDLIYKVHLYGSYSVTKAAWPHMREQGYGRIIMTASAAGIYGNFGQANYSAMKLALLGFANTLAVEGASKNIHVNTIAPVAGTRMTATVMPPELVDALKPEFVTPLVAYLCHEKTESNGGLFEVGAGWVAQLRWERTQGKFIEAARSGELTPEAVRDNWQAITDFSNATHPSSAQESLSSIMAFLNSSKNSGSSSGKQAASSSSNKGNDSVNPSQVVGHKFPPAPFSYTEKDSALYALAVGAAKNPVDEKELRFVYENSSGFSPLPTMGVIFPFSVMGHIMNIPGLKFNPMMLLHGEQYLEIRKPLPPAAKLTNNGKVLHLYDKGKGAVLVIGVDSTDEKGEVLVHNEMTVFIRGIGGFGGDRGPSTNENQPPNRPPDVVHKEKTRDNEALLYRLASGDMNPLHADPSMAAMGGFNKPILHGLCSFGYAGRAVLAHFCDNEPQNFKSVKVRFSKHVFPGETIVTEMWKVSPTKVIFQCKVEERGEYCITNAAVEIAPSSSGSSQASSASCPAGAAGGAFKAEPIFAGLEKEIQSRGADIVKKINGVYEFVLTNGPSNKTQSWLIDLKTADLQQRITTGGASSAKPGVSLTMTDDDFVAMFTGKLDSQTAFMQGKLKIKGDMALAMKLGELVKSKAKL